MAFLSVLQVGIEFRIMQVDFLNLTIGLEAATWRFDGLKPRSNWMR